MEEITIRDIARICGVGVSTVSRAINNHPDINPETKEVKDGIFCETITQKIKEITSPYELYISPYTQNVYFTDAGSYGSAGYLYGYTKEGQPVFAPQKTYVNPAHILALPIYENK